jgi:hypothetical protein
MKEMVVHAGHQGRWESSSAGDDGGGCGGGDGASGGDVGGGDARRSLPTSLTDQLGCHFREAGGIEFGLEAGGRLVATAGGAAGERHLSGDAADGGERHGDDDGGGGDDGGVGLRAQGRKDCCCSHRCRR